MACCGGGGRPRNVRHQAIAPSVEKQSTKTVIQKKITSKQQFNSSSSNRQYIIAHQQCVKCGYPIMLVNISGRERMRCSNSNCGEIV